MSKNISRERRELKFQAANFVEKHHGVGINNRGGLEGGLVRKPDTDGFCVFELSGDGSSRNSYFGRYSFMAPNMDHKETCRTYDGGCSLQEFRNTGKVNFQGVIRGGVNVRPCQQMRNVFEVEAKKRLEAEQNLREQNQRELEERHKRLDIFPWNWKL